MTVELFYDLEIRNLIKPDPRYPELKSCNGWKDFDGMGIACLGIGFDVGHCQAFEWPCSHLLKGDYQFIGFNNHNFDDRLLAVNGVDLSNTVDLLELVRIAACGSPSWEDQPKGYCYSLNALALANGIPPKIGTGELAPILWQQRRCQEVLDYCANDVAILRQLYYRFQSTGIVDPNTSEILKPC